MSFAKKHNFERFPEAEQKQKHASMSCDWCHLTCILVLLPRVLKHGQQRSSAMAHLPNPGVNVVIESVESSRVRTNSIWLAFHTFWTK